MGNPVSFLVYNILRGKLFMCEQIKIKCPKCGYEYFVGEIFFSEDLLGTPTNIIRDKNGNIISSQGELPSFKQEFECDHCGAMLSLKANLKVSTEIKVDFDEEYSTPISRPNTLF